MRLGDFILANVEPILVEWEHFARSLGPGTAMGVIALRDHAEDILRVTARDMVSSQTAEQQAEKSKGHGGGGTESAGLDRASNEHALARLGSGFNLIEVVSEYRALRASVLRLWGQSVRTADEDDLQDLVRFNESIDQSLAEAVKSYTSRLDESRELFLATLGHDLRNPLNAIVVSSELLAGSGQLDEENTRIASQMFGFAKVMTGMIHDLLDFTRTRLGGGMPVSATPIDLQDLCRDVLDEFRATHPHRLLNFESFGDTSGEWDAARLRQVVSNLVANAIQYGGNAAPVEVSARGEESAVLLAVRNQGLPISSSALPTIVPPDGATIRLEATDGESMLELNADGLQGVQQLPNRSAVRVAVTAGDEEWLLSESELTFEDENGRRRTIYLSAMALEPKESVRFWVSANGGTHHAGDEEHAPNFESVARGVPVPWTVRQRGFVVERVASGFQLPVNIAFVPNPGSGADDALFYVAELYGNVQVVTRSGEVREFATNLLDIPPTGHFPGNGESGLAGITVDPESGDVFVTAVYWPDRSFFSLDPRVMRLRASDDGLRAESVETVKGFPGETQSPSHQISQITIGPDRKLYVHLGDGAVHETAQDMNSVRGKILRMNLDGSAPPDNPFYNEADGLTATDYIYSLGYRNPFGGAWRASDRSLYVLENGPLTDRLSKLVAGQNYLWDGVNESMKNFAICTWTSPAAPVQVAFVERETFGGSGFPRSKMGSAFVTESGPTYASGVQAVGKRISEVVLAGETLARGPLPLVEYNGTGKATVSGIAAGPDGLYFTDLYKDFDYEKAIDRGANVFRVRWTGYVLFDVRPVSADGRTIDFVDRSDIDGGTTWSWDFGDGTFGSESSPRHEYAEDGTYVVRLHVTGASGALSRTKKIRVAGERSMLTAEYFAEGVDAITRAESALDFHWDAGSPDPLLPADGFSARWNGTLQPRFSETYRFTVESTDRVRVRVGGVTVINRWEDSSAPATGDIELEAGRDYDLFVEYFDDQGAASLRLFWESGSQLRHVVPQSFSLPRRRAMH